MAMLADRDIEAKAAEFGLSPNDVEKDYVHSWVLKALSTRPLVTSNLVLKGGNALRKAYFPSTRFSKDLDFSATEHVTAAVLEKELLEVCKVVEAQTSIKFLDKALVKDKGLAIPGIEAVQARIYFKG